MRMFSALLAVAGLSVAQLGMIQNPAPVGSIDVATIKPDNSGSGHSHSSSDPGRLTFENVSLKSLIETGFGLLPYQVYGPGWMDDVRFDGAVTFTGLPSDQKENETLLLLGPWLTRQFSLETRRETRSLPGYVLTVVKGGGKLTPSSATTCCSTSTNTSNGLVKMTAETNMDRFVANLGRQLDRAVVVNQTGLPGVYHIELTFAPAMSTGNDVTPGPTIYSALADLGLKLEAKSVPVHVMVVEHAERVPIGN